MNEKIKMERIEKTGYTPEEWKAFIKEITDRATLAERERCAQIAKDYGTHPMGTNGQEYIDACYHIHMEILRGEGVKV